MKTSTTAERLQQIMDERNLKQVDVLALAQPYCKKYGVSLGKTALSQYITGKFQPGQDRLQILGLALNVSEAWLMGFDVPREKQSAPTDEKSGERTEEYIELFNQLNAEQQSFIIHAIKGLLSCLLYTSPSPRD